jgi:hypothetical protein
MSILIQFETTKELFRIGGGLEVSCPLYRQPLSFPTVIEELTMTP